MIEFQNLPNNQPYDKFKDLYISAKKLNQENIEATAISSLSMVGSKKIHNASTSPYSKRIERGQFYENPSKADHGLLFTFLLV